MFCLISLFWLCEVSILFSENCGALLFWLCLVLLFCVVLCLVSLLWFWPCTGAGTSLSLVGEIFLLLSISLSDLPMFAVLLSLSLFFSFFCCDSVPLERFLSGLFLIRWSSACGGELLDFCSLAMRCFFGSSSKTPLKSLFRLSLTCTHGFVGASCLYRPVGF